MAHKQITEKQQQIPNRFIYYVDDKMLHVCLIVLSFLKFVTINFIKTFSYALNC